MKPKRVALLVETSSSWGVGIITGVRDYIRGHSRWVLYVDHRGVYERQNVPTWWEGEGIIAHVMAPALAQYVRLNQVPCVNVSQVRVPDVVVQHVTCDEAAIGTLAVATLLKTGAQHFVYHGPPKRDHYTDRVGPAYARGLAQAGFEVAVVQPDRMLRTDTDPHFNLAEMAAWMQALPRPVAILTWNAVSAFRLLETAAWAGIRIPGDDVFLLSAESDELLVKISEPKLATIDHDPRQVGYQAAAHLDRIMAGGSITAEVLIPPGGVLSGESLPAASYGDPLIRRATQLMTSALASDCSVPELARRLGVSRRTLEVRFRDVLGSSPALELRRLRVEEACRMLSRGELAVADIARDCGFSAVELLQRAMQKHKGMSPSAYRVRMSRSSQEGPRG